MKKSTFFHLVAGCIGGLLFALGMCMCLLPQWNAFRLGVACTAVGAVMLLIQGAVAWISSGRRIRMHWKTFGKVLYGVLASLVFGAGMCMVMVWKLMLPGILVGIVGVVMLLALIPMCLGLK